MSELLSDKLRRRRLEEEARARGEEIPKDFPSFRWEDTSGHRGELPQEDKSGFPMLDWEAPPPKKRDKEMTYTSSYPAFDWGDGTTSSRGEQSQLSQDEPSPKQSEQERVKSGKEAAEKSGKAISSKFGRGFSSKFGKGNSAKPNKDISEKREKTSEPAPLKGMGLLSLFLSFAKVGAMTFGGGYAMLPFLQREIVENKGWATEEELADYFAIGQCTPGIIAVNTATFIGRKQGGIIGGILATLGVVFPSLIIITILAGLIQNFSELEWVAHAFAGIRVCVCVLILNAVLKLFKKAVIDAPTAILFALILLGASLIKVSPIVFVIISAVCGILLHITKLEGKFPLAELDIKDIKPGVHGKDLDSDAQSKGAQDTSAPGKELDLGAQSEAAHGKGEPSSIIENEDAATLGSEGTRKEGDE